MNKKLIFLGIIALTAALIISGCIGGNDSGKAGDAEDKEGKEETGGESAGAGEKNDTGLEAGKEEKEENYTKNANETEEEVNETVEANKTEESEEDDTWCTEIDPEAKMQEQEINGETMNLCCVHHGGGSLRIAFSDTRCYSRDGEIEYRDYFQVKNVDGSLELHEKTIKAGGQKCISRFDANGNQIEETCTQVEDAPELDSEEVAWCESEHQGKMEKRKINEKTMYICCVHSAGRSVGISFSSTWCYSMDNKIEFVDRIQYGVDGKVESHQQTVIDAGERCVREFDAGGNMTAESCKPVSD